MTDKLKAAYLLGFGDGASGHSVEDCKQYSHDARHDNATHERYMEGHTHGSMQRDEHVEQYSALVWEYLV